MIRLKTILDDESREELRSKGFPDEYIDLCLIEADYIATKTFHDKVKRPKWFRNY